MGCFPPPLKFTILVAGWVAIWGGLWWSSATFRAFLQLGWDYGVEVWLVGILTGEEDGRMAIIAVICGVFATWLWFFIWLAWMRAWRTLGFIVGLFVTFIVPGDLWLTAAWCVAWAIYRLL